MIKENLLIDFFDNINCEYKFREKMSRHTTFKIGGEADCFVTVNSLENLSEILRFADKNGIPTFILGNGSNLLVSDIGIDGIVIKLNFDNDITEKDGVITVGADLKLSAFCNFALTNSLTGSEFAWGIPGTVGGAVFMNAGAYGSEIKDIIVSARTVDNKGNIKTYSKDEMCLGYRHSVFKENKEIIIDADFKLALGEKETIKAKMDDLMFRRRDKQPLEYPSAGSVFKRPPNNFAGTLIEQCGLKGKQIGGAAVSTKHAGFIVNVGNATCSDVLDLIGFIKSTVFAETGVKLEQEIAVTGR